MDRDRTRPLRIMRALDAAGPLSTPDLVSLLGDEGEYHQLLTLYGHVLRRHLRRGLVTSPEWTRKTGWRKPRLWAITPLGRQWLQEEEPQEKGIRRDTGQL